VIEEREIIMASGERDLVILQIGVGSRGGGRRASASANAGASALRREHEALEKMRQQQRDEVARMLEHEVQMAAIGGRIEE